MRKTLLKWIVDSDSLALMNKFKARETPLSLNYLNRRKRDLYISLVGELFSCMQDGNTTPDDWSQLGNAFGYFADSHNTANLGINQDDAKLYAATAFYLGGFPASSYLLLRGINRDKFKAARLACIELLTRPKHTKSPYVTRLKALLIEDSRHEVELIGDEISQKVSNALLLGPSKWIPAKLMEQLVIKLNSVNLRAVLPAPKEEGFWDNLVKSFVGRGAWEFFPSQAHAIGRGLLSSEDSFSLQMPTGAGKTALCEVLLYSHLQSKPGSVAVLLVPYRSLAAELRKSLVRNLNSMGIRSRCAYGGTVPTGEESAALESIRALVATPESLSGLLNSNSEFAARVSLVICDEGHLLDSGERGVHLELLLAKIRATTSLSNARYVFASAIVPNIEEINAWLGGNDETVVRSDYRPSVAEFSRLDNALDGVSHVYDLQMHPQYEEPRSYQVQGFLSKSDFKWFNKTTGNMNTFPSSSVKSRAVAAARKSLPLGVSAIFSANKRGNQGVVGIVEELIKQCERSIQLPCPIDYAEKQQLDKAIDYAEREYGPDWTGTKALKLGCVMHHGDIPQETREIIEDLLRNEHASFCVCTNTLAEGVNLPIRTLVLYSVQRLGAGGNRTNMLTRDIKNLVGRAGRAGSTVKGLVICANNDQWHLVNEVATESRGEEVKGFLSLLIKRLYRAIPSGEELTNEMLEEEPLLNGLIDGIDSTLIELFVDQKGEDELLEIVNNIAVETFAVKSLDERHSELLKLVFRLRAARLQGFKSKNQLSWAKVSGARPRLIDKVHNELYPACDDWTAFKDPQNKELFDLLVNWALKHQDMKSSILIAFRLDASEVPQEIMDKTKAIVRAWMSGNRFLDIANAEDISIDDVLGIYTSCLSYSLQTIIEQAVAILEQILEAGGVKLAEAVIDFPECLRYGVSTTSGLALATSGIRHRQSYVYLGNKLEQRSARIREKDQVSSVVNHILKSETAMAQAFHESVGDLVYSNTLEDLSSRTPRKTS